MSVNNWTAGEIETLLALKAAGKMPSEIAERLNRSTKSVTTRLARMKMTPEQKARRLAYENNRLRSKRAAKSGIIGVSASARQNIDVEASILMERDRRYGAPARSLTAAFFGDPPVGYSALERRA
jgi:hypothetical protein